MRSRLPLRGSSTSRQPVASSHSDDQRRPDERASWRGEARSESPPGVQTATAPGRARSPAAESRSSPRCIGVAGVDRDSRSRSTPSASPCRPLGSVVIPAHDEAAVIRRCLDALFSGLDPGELDVVVVCNGCADDTATLARSSGHAVRVVELAASSKPAALRTGDAEARGFPRLYLDADVLLPGSSARRVLERLRYGAVAARPPIRYDSSRSSAPVRSYYR